MKKEKQIIDIKCKPLFLASHKDVSNIRMVSETGDVNYYENNESTGIPLDVYLMSTEPGMDLLPGDIFVTSPGYDELHQCTETKVDSIKGNKIEFNKLIINQQEEVIIENSTLEYEYPLKDTRRIIATSDIHTPYNLPHISKEDVMEMIGAYKDNQELLPIVRFNIYTDEESNVEGMIFPSIRENHSVDIVHKTEAELKTESNALEFWIKNIMPKLNTGFCCYYKFLAMIIDAYKKNEHQIENLKK